MVKSDGRCGECGSVRIMSAAEDVPKMDPSQHCDVMASVVCALHPSVMSAVSAGAESKVRHLFSLFFSAGVRFKVCMQPTKCACGWLARPASWAGWAETRAALFKACAGVFRVPRLLCTTSSFADMRINNTRLHWPSTAIEYVQCLFGTAAHSVTPSLSLEHPVSGGSRDPFAHAASARCQERV